MRFYPLTVTGLILNQSRVSTCDDYDQEGNQSSDEDEMQRVSNFINEVEQVGTMGMNDMKIVISEWLITSGYGKSRLLMKKHEE